MRIILVGINEQGEYVGARLPICLLLFTPVQGWQFTPAFQVCYDDLISLMISSEAISGGKRHFLSHSRDKMAEISRLFLLTPDREIFIEVKLLSSQHRTIPEIGMDQIWKEPELIFTDYAHD